jgi:hypothetical protein
MEGGREAVTTGLGCRRGLAVVVAALAFSHPGDSQVVTREEFSLLWKSQCIRDHLTGRASKSYSLLKEYHIGVDNFCTCIGAFISRSLTDEQMRKMPAEFPSQKEQDDLQETGRIFCLGHLWKP